MNTVTVYSNTSCAYCVMLKNFLMEENIPFEEVNVDENPAVVQKLLQATGRMGVPQTEVNGEWIVGYDRARIVKALKNEEEK